MIIVYEDGTQEEVRARDGDEGWVGVYLEADEVHTVQRLLGTGERDKRFMVLGAPAHRGPNQLREWGRAARAAVDGVLDAQEPVLGGCECCGSGDGEVGAQGGSIEVGLGKDLWEAAARLDPAGQRLLGERIRETVRRMVE